jgi:predicted Abi (CAAX) family protease
MASSRIIRSQFDYFQFSRAGRSPLKSFIKYLIIDVARLGGGDGAGAQRVIEK